MFPNLFEPLNNDDQVRLFLGVDTEGFLLMYPFGVAEENIKQDSYAVYEFNSDPENNLSGPSKVDLCTTTITVYDRNRQKLSLSCENIRRVIEKYAVLTSIDTDYDFDTKRYIMIMYFDWFYDR